MKCNKNIKSNIKYKTPKINLVRNVQKPMWEKIDKILPVDIKENLKIYHIHGWVDLIL